jgi:hypothetical protein
MLTGRGRDGRCLEEHTVRRFRLGYVPEPRWLRAEESGKRVKMVGPGVLIPWVAPAAWYEADGPDPEPEFRWCGANVRRLDWVPGEPDKYLCISGSSRGYLYPFGDLTPGVPALLVEGELDSLVAWQEAGWVVNAGTVGGSAQAPKPTALGALQAAPSWLVLPDADGAGEAAYRRWEARDPERTIPVQLPRGKDLTEFVRAGGDVPTWLAAEFRGLGWTPPRGS